MSVKCCVEDCLSIIKAKGLCQAHYVRMLRGQDLSKPLTRAGTDEERFKAKTKLNPDTGCWEWTASKNTNGYGQFSYQGTPEQAHRVAWLLFRGAIPADDSAYGTLNVLHKCDNPVCVNPEHLFLGDQSANIFDAVSKDRWGKRGLTGEAHGRAMITENDVRKIRSSKECVTALAERFHISTSAIRHILKRRSWKHL